MSNTYNRTTEVPSRTSIVFGVAVTSLNALGTAFIVVAGSDFDARHFVGSCFGVLAMATVAGQTLIRIVQRDEALSQKRNETGTWRHPQKGVVTVSPWEWPDRERLTTLLTQMEQDGYQPVNDAPTRAIRARLMLPG